MRRILAVVAGSLLFLAIGGTPASAGPLPVGPIVSVSGASPFPAGCGLTAGGGTLTINSEVEPWVEVSPANANLVAGLWQQDRWSNGGSRGNVAGLSFDGGATFSLLTFPGVTQCTGGSFDRASDPWLSFSPNGDLHVMHLVLNILPPPGLPGGFGSNGMMVQKIPAAAFADNVVTPAEVTAPILIAFDDKGDLHDKNSLTADRTNSNNVYAVWDFLDIPTGSAINPDRVPGLGFKGAALFSRTTNGGQTWSAPTVLYNPGGNNQTLGNQIVVGGNGVLYNFFIEILNFRNDDGGPKFDLNLSMKFSANQGGTWLPNGTPIRIADVLSAPVRIPAGDANAGAPVRTSDILFDVAVNPATNNLYATWMDTRFSGGARNEIAFAQSTNGGVTWSTPIKVSKTPTSDAHMASVEVAANGVVGVSHYDARFNVPGGGTDTDHWLVHCHASCSSASSWVDESRVGTSFDIQRAPFARGFFLGDYVGLSHEGNKFAALFTQTSPADPASQAYAEIG